MNPLHAASLNVNDKIENVNGQIGLVIAVNKDINCLAVAWEGVGIFLYRRSEFFPGVALYQAAKPSEQLDLLPTTALNSLYTVPDPSSWLIAALIGWHQHGEALERIAEHGPTSSEDSQLACAACSYIRSVLARMRGVVIDFTQN